MNTESQTDQLKQRIAEAIKPFWGNYIIGRDVCQLLQDCLKHIEELERQVATKQYHIEDNGRLKRELERADEKCNQLQSQLREREAEIELLKIPLAKVVEQVHAKYEQRLQSVEKERDRYRTALEKLSQLGGGRSEGNFIAQEALK